MARSGNARPSFGGRGLSGIAAPGGAMRKGGSGSGAGTAAAAATDRQPYRDGGGCEVEGAPAPARLDRPARRKNGGKLTAEARSHIAPKNFALPGRRYPIEDASHARNALARVSQNGTPAEKAKVRSAVHRKYPGIGSDD